MYWSLKFVCKAHERTARSPSRLEALAILDALWWSLMHF